MIAEILGIIAPVLICIGIGFVWAKAGRKFDTPMVTFLVTYFSTPALVFYTLSTVDLSLEALFAMGGAAVAANILFAVIGAVCLWLAGLSQRTFLQSLTWPNVGNIGLPLCLLAFGEEGLALAIGFFAVYVVIQLTVGVAFVSGQFTAKSLISMPIIPATVIAMVILVWGVSVPQWILSTTRLIGDLTIPLMLITLGVSLASLKVVNITRSIWLALFRLGIGFTVGLMVSWGLDLEGVARGVVILQCALPVAVFCYLFAQLYNRQPEEVASLVVISTTLSIATLPVLMWYVLQA
ncbi:AEC family transporter [Kiloniella laminariae]|uniref:AEC family transporter n=1 Tax=Kiloniella laminariae TaxID=454162 RepID=A0ABT4LLZ5_9PROT|nr:AEC family transporter [Kiloniella laminariae]MCZ4282089.1 AEC family transporter [Kiloniella laminariae]